jgi:molybdopterin/thiamine biosynthesis adenylyltransferase
MTRRIQTLQKPRIKSVFPPLPLGDGIIRIGGVDYGLAAELHDDEQGHVWQLLSLLDGTRTMDEVAQAMQASDADLSVTDVRAAVDELVEAGYVEDAAREPAPGLFTPTEAERYRRNLDFFSYFHLPPLTNYDLQVRLKQSRVTVLGLGGLGSFVALSLASAGVGNLLLVDDDVVELSNLNRQVLYTADDLGQYKCEAAARRLALVNPHVNVTARNLRVSSVEDARSCIAGRDLVVCAADRPRIRIYEWLNAATVAERVAWVRGANDGLTVNLFLHVPGETACFECEQARAYAMYPWYRRVVRYAMEEIGDRTINPCTAPIAGLIGNLTAFEVVKYLTGCATPAAYNRKLIFDLQTLETRFLDGERQPGCPACGALSTGAEVAA